MLKPWVILRSNLNHHGMALWPFVFIKREHADNKALLNHELIHIRQQLELFIIPFYLLYIVNYGVNLLKYRNHRDAYMNICFEREAYSNESDFDYLHHFHYYGWINRLTK